MIAVLRLLALIESPLFYSPCLILNLSKKRSLNYFDIRFTLTEQPRNEGLMKNQLIIRNEVVLAGIKPYFELIKHLFGYSILKRGPWINIFKKLERVSQLISSQPKTLAIVFDLFSKYA